jgi:beta-glucosidase
MQYIFPPDFIFGTSTAATQIETAFEHDWQGVTSKDGYVLDRTTDHEIR